MHDDWRASCACITAAKWAQATTDLRWKESWDEEFAPEHRHKCVGISSERISHLIKTSAQFPGELSATPASYGLHSSASHRKFSAGGACFFLLESVNVVAFALLVTWCPAEWACASCLPLKLITPLRTIPFNSDRHINADPKVSN